MTTKNQELEALEQIRLIVNDLGDDSYVAFALNGTLDIAAENIRDDAMDSLADRLSRREAELREAKAQLSELQEENDRLNAELEKAQGWHVYKEDGTCSCVTQKEYEHLKHSGEALSDEKAADLVASEFGFNRGQIEIIHELETWEINRMNQLRKTGTIEREPIYGSSDWNYVRFNVKCGGITWFYEMDDGDLMKYNC